MEALGVNGDQMRQKALSLIDPKAWKSIADFLASPILLHFSLPFVMLYLTLGTLAQKYIGLYQATKIYFSDLVIWLGALPLPGFPILMAIMGVNIIAKLWFKSPWSLRHSGIIVAHLSVALLLFGGLLTALMSEEGFLDLAEGQSKSFASDYHMREFVVLDVTNNQRIQAWPHLDLSAGQTVQSDALPFTIKILETCQNCKIEKRETFDEAFNYNGMAQFMRLTAGDLKLQNEENMSGLAFKVSGPKIEQPQIFVSLEDVPRWPEVTINDVTYRMMVQKIKRSMPFSVELIDVEKIVHPGTALAREYQSHVRIRDERGEWESLIRMNEPLRYRGYTLFQSSFSQSQVGEVSVLAVVRNVGRSFPYIAGLIMALGLVMHMIFRKR